MPEALFHSTLPGYLDSLVPERTAVMAEMEAHAREVKFNIVGPAAGHLLYQVARMIGARSVFELGSGFGYSTAWFARTVHENGGGDVHHVVWHDDLSRRARGYLGRLGYADLMRYHVGEAVAILEQTAGPFHLIFNDIDKEGYPVSIAAIKQKLRPGGVLLIDNTLCPYGCISLSWGRRSAMAERIKCQRRVTVAPETSQRSHPIRTRTSRVHSRLLHVAPNHTLVHPFDLTRANRPTVLAVLGVVHRVVASIASSTFRGGIPP